MMRAYDPDSLTAAERAILEERARRLAAPADTPIDGATADLVVLALGTECYGIDVRFVREVRPLESIAPVPGVPVFWTGLVNLRGHLYPLLDLGNLLGLPPRMGSTRGSAEALPAKVVLTSAAGLEVGLLADDVLEVRQVLVSEIGPALVERDERPQAWVVGVTPDLLAVLDVETLLSDPRLQAQAG